MPDATAQEIASKSWIEITFKPDPGFKLLFGGLHGREELGRPFFYDLGLSIGTLEKDVGKKLLGTSCTIWLAQSDEKTEDKYLNGVVTRVVSSGLVDGAYHYRVEVRPWIWLLSRVTDSLIFQKMKAFDIITKVFRDAHFSNFEDKRQASAGDTELEYCVQYRESSFDFVHRLMEQFGIYYFFKHEDGKHTLCLADDPNAHEALSDKIPYVFDQTENRTVSDHIWEWQAEFGLESGKFTFRDYNFTTPSADLTAKTLKPAEHDSYKDLEQYDYPGPYEETSVGQKLTDVRMQAIAMQRTILDGVSNSRKLHPGWRFTMEHHAEEDLNREYLITRAEFSIGAADATARTEGDTLDSYRVTLRAIPGDVPFRLERHTPVPMIRGPQTAKVVGDSGEEITTDEYGRVKVQFHWDRSDTAPDQRSCWIRVAQAWAGAGWGSIFIPRMGQEVVVEFLEGNPDRPLITGVVYNATNTVPYALPGNKTQSGVKTNSSQGSGFNELRFEDKAGSEEVFFQAQKDFTKNVLNNETSKVKNDHTTTIESGNHSTTVSSGNHKLDISSGTSEITAATSITLKVGGNSIKIDTAGVTINGTKVDIAGQATASLKSASTTVSGDGNVAISGGIVAIN